MECQYVGLIVITCSFIVYAYMSSSDTTMWLMDKNREWYGEGRQHVDIVIISLLRENL